MNGRAEKVAKWFYRGVWGVLTRRFCVPDRPPTLPTAPGEAPDSFQPAEGFLRYLKLHFWIYLILIDVAILIAWIVIITLIVVNTDWDAFQEDFHNEFDSGSGWERVEPLD